MLLFLLLLVLVLMFLLQLKLLLLLMMMIVLLLLRVVVVLLMLLVLLLPPLPVPPFVTEYGDTYVSLNLKNLSFLCLCRLTLEAQTWLGFTMLGCTTLSLGLFVCVFLVARKHGSRFSRPQTAGYELASQEELNQELLDEEDEEDFEVSSGPPTLRLKSVGSADDA